MNCNLSDKNQSVYCDQGQTFCLESVWSLSVGGIMHCSKNVSCNKKWFIIIVRFQDTFVFISPLITVTNPIYKAPHFKNLEIVKSQPQWNLKKSDIWAEYEIWVVHNHLPHNMIILKGKTGTPSFFKDVADNPYIITESLNQAV